MADSETYAVRRAIAPDARFSTWTAPDGWPHRRFDWPAAAPRGRILIQGGRADVIEKYLETMAHCVGRGWSVTAFDWRGQGGSGRLAPDPHVGHADDFAPWIADLATFWREWSAAGEGPRVLLGHSMGGHLALRSMLDGGTDPDGAILVAPMMGVRSPIGTWLGARLADWQAGRGDPARPAWKVRGDPRSAGHRQKLLTHDVGRFADEAFWYDRQPTLRLGPPSWAWVREAFAASARLVADPGIDRLRVPILMLVADADGLVDPRAALAVAERLPNATLVRFGPESAHEILREGDAVRQRAYAAIDDFLEARARRA